MKNFSLVRFLKLARWSLATDRRWFLKIALSWLAVFILIFLLFTCLLHESEMSYAYHSCVFLVVFLFIAILVFGPTMMFNSMTGKHDDQRLLMPPASNLEKYLVRYSYWLLLLPCYIGAVVIADLLQYAVNQNLGHEETMLVMQLLGHDVSRLFGMEEIPFYFVLTAFMIFAWIHSLYVVGATFFRSHRWNWLQTTLVLIAFGFVLGILMPKNISIAFNEHEAAVILNVVYALLIAFNFWLSYKFFCRRQAKDNPTLHSAGTDET